MRHRRAAPAAIAVKPPAWSGWPVRALDEVLTWLRGSARRNDHEQQQWRVRSLKLPDPMPGVLPDKAPRMAQDSQIAAVYNGSFGANFGGYGWDGYGFMGYALLSDLAQVPEYRKPSEILANEMTRKWVKIISTSDQDKTDEIGQINAELKRIKAQETFRRAYELDNFFGHGQIYIDIGTKGPELATEMALDVKVGKGSLKGIRTIEPIWVYPNAYNSVDPLRADFYKPQTWFVMGTEVHASRLLNFISRPVPDMLKPAYLFGGVSLTQLLRPYVDNWLRTRQSVSDITHNFSTPVFKTDMGQIMSPGGAQALALRGQVFNTARDNQGLMILDMNKEDFVNVSAPISGLDRLQAQAQEQMAAIAGIPLVKLFGITPSGLNASSDGEVRVFYDTIESAQERVGSPNFHRLLDVVQMSLFGRIDPDIGFTWEPLWSLDEEKMAAVRKVDAETDCALVDHGILDPLEVRRTLASDEDSRYASIDVEDVPEPPDQGQAPGGEDVPEARLPHAGEKRDAPVGDEFREGDHPRGQPSNAGQFGPGGGGAARLTPAQAKQKVASYLSRDKAKAAIAQVAKSVATKVKDPETIKGALGAALNAAIGHYWLGHTDFDAAIIADAVQHIEVGLAVSAAQAKDTLRKTVDALIGAYRKPARGAAADAEPETDDDDDDDEEFLKALVALRKALDDGAAADAQKQGNL